MNSKLKGQFTFLCVLLLVLNATAFASEDLLEKIIFHNFLFFQENTHPQTGLVRDKVLTNGSADFQDSDVASIAATGFGLSALCVGVDRGFISKDKARQMALNTLDFLYHQLPHQKGWYYHFISMDSGQRKWNSEVSSIDTALLLAGVLTVKQCFKESINIRNLADQIYHRIDFQWMLNNDPLILSHGWYPESGFIPHNWDTHSELLILYLLAIGSPTHPINPQSWDAWKRTPVAYGGHHYISGAEALFIHQYGQAWVDFRNQKDQQGKGVDWFYNSQVATVAHRQFCMDLSKEFPHFSSHIWGITASDSANGYKAWGGPPRHPDIDGTIVPCALTGSVMFTPSIATKALEEIYQKYGHYTWGRYGFSDAFNPQTRWSSPFVLGIDKGIGILSIENHKTQNVWKWFMRNKEIQIAMKRSGFKKSL